MFKRFLTTLCCMVVFLGCCGLLFFYRSPGAHAARPHTPGTWKQFSYTNIWGSRVYSVYTPAHYQVGTAVPMIVMLPGCTQNGAALASLTKMDTLADQQQFIVVYPEQSFLANPTLCWNWYLEINEFRGAGEPSIIAGITQ